MAGMDPHLVPRLRCPVCAEPLAEVAAGTARALRCPRRHSFDIARQGYVNLLTGRAPHQGDTPEMVAARADFLAAGHYEVISEALARAAVAALDRVGAAAQPGYPLVVDAGAGTGRHLATVLAALPGALGLALDLSKPALRRAARAHPRAAAALADTWQRLPLAEGAATLLLNVFAPRNGAEFHRVLDPAGTLLVVTPAEDHLTELVQRLGLLRVDPAKADRVQESLAGHFDRADSTLLRRRLTLTPTEVTTLVGMGPSAWHRSAPDPGTDPTEVTLAVRLTAYRPRAPRA
jgi:23S rRNA (guanine745-N1)-methyltransferase